MKAVLCLAILSAVSPFAPAAESLRVGLFPNVTHAHALVAKSFSREGRGWFEERVGLPIEWFVFNAGPSAMEAIFARSIDFTYVGPSPAVNAYARANGRDIQGRRRRDARRRGARRPRRHHHEGRGLSRQDDCHTAIGQHPGCRVPSLADQQWDPRHPGRRRRARPPDGQPRHSLALSTRKTGCRLDG